jgi:hypothetical protein
MPMPGKKVPERLSGFNPSKKELPERRSVTKNAPDRNELKRRLHDARLIIRVKCRGCAQTVHASYKRFDRFNSVAS